MDVQELKTQILKELRNPKIYLKDVLKYLEDNIEDAFNIACRKKLSINEWKPDATFGDQINQKTVLLTVRMFDLWETALVDVLTKHLSDKFKGVSVEHARDAVGDLIIKFPEGSKVNWEIKTTQGKDSFTGATHSASKCNNYILISYAMDKDMKLKKGSNPGFITEIAVFVWDNMSAVWVGEPSENSSWTTLRFSSDVINMRPEIVVVGSLERKFKWCKIIRKKLVNSDKKVSEF